MAWLTGWNYRKKLTLDSSKIDSDCSDFPVKAILDKDNFDFSKARSDGNDLRFTASDGETLLKHERELHASLDWGKFNGTIDGTYNTFDITNADYLSLRFHRLGAMNKYALLDNSIDASSDFTFSFKIYISSITTGSFGSVGAIGLSDNTTNGSNTIYLAADLVYDTDTSAKAYISSRFEGSSPNMGTGFAYSDGIELNAETTYIVKLSKTSSTLKVAVCNSSEEELWSDTAVASTTPTLTYFKIWDYTPGNGTPYVDFRLSDFYNGSTEETFKFLGAVYHVKVPTASSTSNTDVYMYYGKADATDGADPTNVWDSNYELVMHMDSALLDSTSNDNDGTNSGTTLGTARDGYYRSFDGSNDYIDLTGLTIANTSDLSFEIMAQHAESAHLFDAQTGRWVIGWNLTDNLGVYYNSWFQVTTDIPADGGMHLVGVTLDQGTERKIYIDANSPDAAGSGPTVAIGGDVIMGARYALNSAFYNGKISECRISSTLRSDAWIKATYHSLADTLLTYGSEEALRPRVMVVWA